MQAGLKNKTAIVTGASRGIGRAIALKLGQSGASVVVNYANNAKAADEVVSQIIENGGQAFSLQADMQKISEIKALFDASERHFGSIDILVNNAGIALFKKIADITEKEFDDSFALNVKGLFFACQQAAQKMADGGKIINISSSVTKMMLPDYGVYAATKGAVEQITKVLAKELGHRKIAVNAISPGPVDTELFRQGKTEQQIQNLADMAAFGRIGTPGDIAGAVLLLVSGEAGWISGQNLCVNGGFAA
ncbi:3-oxoacyl-[acyl-carrier protein] reductase [Desulfosalsimonas propionicica]|uniref:3-oxoacyl-[acyl-carrier protein] reductase n=1 Tax=Desulfosalsimonas propionicica TaxID=332175 RepID=A0A7W0CB58_9BACT|nr:SDR family oxidoreductase [Desulfosalsimonas propionicica]MBA2882511.1 3-oxoacyl-[acyl-carrier protein] reductase [Desulfosalsimonas propionicica]